MIIDTKVYANRTEEFLIEQMNTPDTVVVLALSWSNDDSYAGIGMIKPYGIHSYRYSLPVTNCSGECGHVIVMGAYDPGKNVSATRGDGSIDTYSVTWGFINSWGNQHDLYWMESSSFTKSWSYGTVGENRMLVATFKGYYVGGGGSRSRIPPAEAQ